MPPKSKTSKDFQMKLSELYTGAVLKSKKESKHAINKWRYIVEEIRNEFIYVEFHDANGCTNFRGNRVFHINDLITQEFEIL
jgi:hypothetical protein